MEGIAKGMDDMQSSLNPRQVCWYSPQPGSNAPAMCVQAQQSPHGTWYNVFMDIGDTIERDAEGRWVWSSFKTAFPTVWDCTLCLRPAVMECTCCMTTDSTELFLHRVMDPGEYTCVHRTRDPAFVCKDCRTYRPGQMNLHN